jgi:two-component system CheB/CheR fusion protein
VVGLGASAGGLDAFKKFFSVMPADSGLAFVLVQHLDPTHESLMVELLARVTPMKVVQIVDRMPVAPNQVYMIPPNRTLMISQGVLHLAEPIERRGMRVPIDIFFRSLAEDQQERAIGVILSGTGTEGTLGLKAIRANGGVTLAQSPETAHYDGMPRSAIAAGVVDHAIPVEQMPEILISYAKHWYVHGKEKARPREAEPADYLEAILALLSNRFKYEFRGYKKTTLNRRIQRRMVLRHIERGYEYLKLLHSSPEELNSLFKDMLISVSGFFRDREAWQVLAAKVIPTLVKDKKPDAPIRVWVPGCATGEEAYTIAILLLEQLQEMKRNGNLQIFATDIDEEALAVARRATYPASIAADISPERLHRFFVSQVDSYTASKMLRDSVMFATQNVISDVPYSKLDLISCRNLLIYLDLEVQNKLITLFHFALREGGYLYLGNAETIGQKEDLFSPIAKKWRIYRRASPLLAAKVDFPVFPALPLHLRQDQLRRLDPSREPRFTEIAQKLVLERFAPACVLINRKFEILYFQGPTHDFLTQPAGPPTQDLLDCAREGLRTKLRGALHRALQKDQPVTIGDVRVRRGAGSHAVRVSITPIKDPKMLEGLFLVAFEDQPQSLPPAGADAPPLDDTVVRDLEDELKATREDLQGSIEQLESANEELKSANEEVMSMNEELQSVNEELETSKEELQSMNEELTTVNNQLEGKIIELEATNDDLSNLLISTNIATIFLDTLFRIRRFTPAATRLVNLIQADAGRPLSDLTIKFTDPDLLPDAQAVLKKLIPIEKEVRTQDDRWYLRQVLPYRTEDNRIVGVVLTFSDITDQKQAKERTQKVNEELELHVQQRTAELESVNQQLRHQIGERERAEHGLREREARLRAIVDAAADAIITIDDRGTIESFNPAAESMFQCRTEEVIGKNINTIIASFDSDNYMKQLRQSGGGKLVGVRREVAGQCRDGTTFPVDLVLSAIRLDDRRLFTIIARNISERRTLEREVLEGRSQEKQRISRDLHDRVGQELTGLGFLASGLAQDLGSGPQAEACEKIVQGIDRVIGEVRNAIRGLTPVPMDALGLSTALEELAARTTEQFGIPCRFTSDRPVKIEDNEISTHLYFIAQEAVHNSARHAHARNIEIALEGDGDGGGDQITLQVSDDGVGIGPEREIVPGMGLHIMQYRAAEIGATFDVAERDGSGTRVTCSLPRGSGND